MIAHFPWSARVPARLGAALLAAIAEHLRAPFGVVSSKIAIRNKGQLEVAVSRHS